jgi:hypothetical protein
MSFFLFMVRSKRCSEVSKNTQNACVCVADRKGSENLIQGCTAKHPGHREKRLALISGEVASVAYVGKLREFLMNNPKA